MTRSDSWVAAANDLMAILDLEAIDRDLFRGPVVRETRGGVRSLYGGRVAAQALRAAGLTVPEGRYPHSLHGYFLRRGQDDRPVILQVDRDRDGRSFSSRHVNALQNGEVIFSMLASFHVDEESGDYETEGPTDLPDPDSLPERYEQWVVEVREIHAGGVVDGVERHSDRMWTRVRHPLPDDRLVHACALAFVSDLGTGFGQLDVPRLATGGSSIDHSVWFHRSIRMDDWVLLDLRPVMAGGARGVYLGSVRDRHGALAAMLSQEILLRPG